MVLSANGRLLFSITTTQPTNGSILRNPNFWDLLTGKDAFSFPVAVSGGLGAGQGSPIRYQIAALSPDGRRVVVGTTRDANLIAPGPLTLRSWDIGTGLELGALGEYPGIISGGLTFSPDGSRLAVVQAASTRIVNATTGVELVTLGRSQGITTLAFSRDGVTVAAAVPGGVRAWRTADGQERWFVSSGAVTQMAFNPDGRLLATALEDRTIHILDSDTGGKYTQMAGHIGTIRALSFTPDGTRLVSVGDDKVVRVWGMRNLTPSRVFDARRTGPVSVEVNPDGHTLLIRTRSTVKSWDSNTSQSGFERASQHGISFPVSSDTDFTLNGARIALRNSTLTPVVGGQAMNSYLQILDARTGSEIAVLRFLARSLQQGVVSLFSRYR